MTTPAAPILAGKYHLLRKLGAGGMAEVYLAKQVALEGFEKLVVIKRILPHLAQDDEFVTMFLDEARTAADLRHPNVVNVMEVAQDEGTYYMAMEFLHGQDIRRLQRTAAKARQPIPANHCCQIAIDAANGLNYAHAKSDLTGRPLNIVHRDVSPQNIIITYDGSTKIVDFGIAKAATQDAHTATGVIKGKYTYMSPEQAQGEPIDGRSDQFALGIVFWEMLTMRRLFKRSGEVQTLNAIIECDVPRPTQFVPDLPEHLEHIVMQMLARDPEDRFDSCHDLVLELEEFCAEAQLVHSPARVGAYMREMFHDELERESELGLGMLDGESFSMSTPSAAAAAAAAPAGTEVARKGSNASRRSKAKAAPALVDLPDGEVADPGAETAFARTGSEQRVRGEDSAASGSRSGRSQKSLSLQIDVEEPELGPDVADDAGEDKTLVTGTAAPVTVSEGMATPDTGAHTQDNLVSVTVTAPTTPPRAAFPVAATLIGLLTVVIAAAVAFVIVGGDEQEAELTVSSDPEGAQVYVDGTDTGQITPAIIHGLNPSTLHEVTIFLDGHRTEKATVRFGSPPVAKLALELTPKPGFVPKVTGTMGEVKPVDDPGGDPSGETDPDPATGEGEGERAVEADPDKADPDRAEKNAASEAVGAAAGGTGTRTAGTGTRTADKPKPRRPGKLRIVAKPWANVYLNGRKIGQTPMKARTLPAGRYRVTLKNPEIKKSKTFNVTLRSGGDEKVKVDWR